MSNPIILAIDATNRAHAMWHGTGGHGTANAFFRQLDMIIDKINPTWTVACFDRPSFRKEIEPGYKSSRQPNPEVAELIAEIKSELELLAHVEACEIDGMEADDLLASFAQFAVDSGYQAVLQTADKDCRQCLRDGQVSILKTAKIKSGKIELSYETANSVEEKFGVHPEDWPDYQMMIGDAGDDIKGVDGIGPKIAAKLLKVVGPMKLILAEPARCPIAKSKIDKLVAFRSRADVVRQLVTLRTDLEVKPWLL